MQTVFFERSEKAAMGIPCNQKSDGSLWVGKGYKCPLAEQLGAEIERAVRKALERGRGDRNGRFFVNIAKRTVTMYFGASYDNDVKTETF